MTVYLNHNHKNITNQKTVSFYVGFTEIAFLKKEVDEAECFQVSLIVYNYVIQFI
jgi:hypothetical protein